MRERVCMFAYNISLRNSACYHSRSRKKARFTINTHTHTHTHTHPHHNTHSHTHTHTDSHTYTHTLPYFRQWEIWVICFRLKGKDGWGFSQAFCLCRCLL